MGILPEFEDMALYRRAKVDAWKTVFGGIVAASVFSFIQDITSQNYVFIVDMILGLSAVVSIYIAVYFLAIFFYRQEYRAPAPKVELAESDHSE